MAERIPLVLVNGVHRQIDPADTIPASNVPNGISTAQAAKLAAVTQAQADLVGLGAKATGTITMPTQANTTNGDVVTAGGQNFTAWKSGSAPAAPYVDIQALGTAQELAVALAAVVNATTACTVTAGTPVSGVIPWTAKSYGAAGNVVPSGTWLGRTGASASSASTGLPPQVSPTTPLATALNPGTISAANFSKIAAPTQAQMNDLATGKLLSISGGGWADRMMQQAQVLVPELTTFVSQRMGLYPNGVPTLPDGLSDQGTAIDGGLLQWDRGDLNPIQLTSFIIANPSASKWAFAFRGSMPYSTIFFALSNLALSSYVTIVTSAGVTALGLQVGATKVNSSFLIDANMHDFLVTFDLTTVTLVVDGTVVGTNTTLTTIPTVPCALLAADFYGQLRIQEYGFGYV